MPRGDADRIEPMLDALLRPVLGQLPSPLPGAVGRTLGELAAARTDGDVRALLRQLVARPDAEALDALVTAATVTYTSFLRHPEQFDRLRGWLRPRRGRVRMWSAGCATGEEAYSLAWIAESAGVDYEVLGTDVDPEALRVARHGVYRAAHPAFGVDARGPFQVPEGLRQRVRFERASVLAADPAPGHGAFDVIFCRNVLIYFDPEMVTEIITRLRDRLFDHGVLALGPVESLALLPSGLERGEPLGWIEQVRGPCDPVPRFSTLPPWPHETAPATQHERVQEQLEPSAEPLGSEPDLERAARALGIGQTEVAEAMLRALLTREPTRGEAWFLLAEALLQRGEAQQARTAFELAAQHADPEMGDAMAAAARRRARDCV